MTDQQTNSPANGIELSARFYAEAVAPILAQHWPELDYAAALIGSGSEVLGYDDAMSTDHHWGPRVLLFVRPADYPRAAAVLPPLLAQRLPRTFGGYPTNFSEPDPADHGVQLLEEAVDGPINHRVDVLTPDLFIRQQLNFDLTQPLRPVDWLTFSEQKLLSITAGALFHDAIGLEAVRQAFAYYPHDVWLYLQAAVWTRIGQEEHLMGRAGLAGDELGSALIAARLARDVMRLCFLQARTYAPYAKWFGTAFRRLPCGPELYPVLQEALAAHTWQDREEHLCTAYRLVARRHNELGLTAPMPQDVQPFFGRPFQVIALHGFAAALCAEIADPAVKTLTEGRLLGSLDLFSDNVDLVENIALRPTLLRLYAPQAITEV